MGSYFPQNRVFPHRTRPKAPMPERGILRLVQHSEVSRAQLRLDQAYFTNGARTDHLARLSDHGVSRVTVRRAEQFPCLLDQDRKLPSFLDGFGHRLFAADV